MKTWLTFQLSEKGESVLDEEPKVIEDIIKKHLKKTEYFLPLYYSDKKSFDHKIYLYKGYVFVEYLPELKESYNKLINTQYFANFLTVGKSLHLLPDSEIKSYRKKLKKMMEPKIKIGEEVRVIDGKYKNCIAIVNDIYEEEKEVDLTVNLRCMSIVVPRIPMVCLKNLSKSTKKETLNDKILAILEDNYRGLNLDQIIARIGIKDEDINPKVVFKEIKKLIKSDKVYINDIDGDLEVYRYKKSI